MKRRWIAHALLALCLVGAAASLAFAQSFGDGAFALVFAVYAGVGWLIIRSQPGNSIGWLLLAFGALGGVHGLLEIWGLIAARAELPGAAFAGWSQSWLWAPMLGVTFGPLLVLFPDGRLLSPRWRIVLWLSGVFVVLAVVGNALYPFPAEEGDPNPYAVASLEPLLKIFQDVAGFAMMICLGSGVLALILRYRRGGAVQRQQLKWFLAATATLPFAVVLGEMWNQALQDIVVPISLGFLAAAMGIAILRYRLYDIDRIISRTVSWALITLVIAGLYLGCITLLTWATASVAGKSTVAVAAATLLAAAAFGPVRRRIQAGVDRRFNRARYDAAKTVEAYRGQLRDDLDVASVSQHLMTAVAVTLQPRTTSLWLSPPSKVQS